MPAAVSTISLPDLLGFLLAIHRREEREFAKLTDEQLEERAARSDAHAFFRADAWQFAATEVCKHSGVSECRLAEFAGNVNLGIAGAEDVAELVAGLDAALTPVLLAKLAEDYPGVTDGLGALNRPRRVDQPIQPKPALEPAMPPDDKLLTLQEATAHVPGTPSYSTIYRWCTKGQSGIRLESWVTGGTTCTTMAAIKRFSAQLAERRFGAADRAEVAPTRTPCAAPDVSESSTEARGAEVQRTMERLEREGF